VDAEDVPRVTEQGIVLGKNKDSDGGYKPKILG